MCDVNVLFWDVLDELLFDFQGSFGSQRYQTQSAGNPENMRINGHIGLIPNYRGDDICGLAAHSGEFDEFLDSGGDFSTKVFDQHFAQTDQVFGFIVWVGDGSNIGEKGIKICGGQMSGRGEMLEKFLGDNIDSFVGALGRKNDSHEQLEGIFVLKLRLRNRHIGGKMSDESVVSLFFKHVLESLGKGV